MKPQNQESRNDYLASSFCHEATSIPFAETDQAQRAYMAGIKYQDSSSYECEASPCFKILIVKWSKYYCFKIFKKPFMYPNVHL